VWFHLVIQAEGVKPWQVGALRLLEEHPEGATSRAVWEGIAEQTGISRASVISFLEEMAEAGFFVK